MSVADKLTTIAENEPKVFDAGKQAEYDRFWNDFQDYGNRDMYGHAFSGGTWNEKTFKPKYKIVPRAGTTTCWFMFSNFGGQQTHGSPVQSVDFTELSKMLDFSNATTATNTFESARIKNLTVDFSSITSMRSTFQRQNGGDMDGLYIKVSEKCTDYTNAFSSRTDLTTVRFIDGSIIAASINFQWSNLLTVESAKSVIKCLKNFTGTGKEYTCTVRFHDDVWAALDAEGNTSPIGGTWRDYANAYLGWNI